MRNKIVLFIVVVLVISLFYFFYRGLDQKLKITNYNFDSNKVKKTIKIAQISDLHAYLYGENQNELVNKIREAEPDIIAITGDFSSETMSFDNCEILLQKMKGIAAIYYVSGNHEHYDFRYEELLRLLKKYQVVRLNNEHKDLEIEGNRVALSGFEDPYLYGNYYATSADFQRLARMSQGIDNSKLNILLSHRPELASQYDKHDYDIILTGHAHGGQFRLPGVKQGLLAPNQGLLPKYTKGVYRLKYGSNLVVSSGLVIRIIPRLYNNPELVLITIKSS